MPSNLTDTSSFDVVTAPIGTDIRNAASVRNALQTLANRTRFLFDRTDPMIGGVTALKALPAPPDGTVRLVEQLGSYIFDSSSVLAESLPWVVAPNAGGGRWLHELYAIQGEYLAKLNGTRQLIIHQSSGFPTFETARSRTVFQPPVVFGGLKTGWSAMDSDFSPGILGPATGVQQYFLLTEMHDGATFASIEAFFKPASGHAALPATFPYVDVFTVSDANDRVSISVAASGTNYPSPGTVAAYEATGLRSWAHSIAASHVVSRSTKVYYVKFIDEQGTNSLAGMRLIGFKLNFTSIPDLRFA